MSGAARQSVFGGERLDERLVALESAGALNFFRVGIGSERIEARHLSEPERGGAVCVAMGRGLFYRLYESPAGLRRSEIVSSIRLNESTSIPFGSENVYHSYSIVERLADRDRILFAAARAGKIESILAVAGASGITIERIAPVASSLSALLERVERLDGRRALFVHLDDGVSGIHIFENDRLIYTREVMAHPTATEESIAIETERAFGYWSGSTGLGVDFVWTVGARARDERLIGALRERVGGAARPYPRSSRLGALTNLPEDRLASMAIVIGGACLAARGAARDTIDLAPSRFDRFAHRYAKNRAWFNLAAAFALGVVLIAIAAARVVYLERAIERVATTVSVGDESRARLAALEESIASFNDRAARLEERLGRDQPGGGAARFDFGLFLDRLASAVPSDVALDEIHIQSKGSSVYFANLKGVVRGDRLARLETLARFIENIEERLAKGRVDFRIGSDRIEERSSDRSGFSASFEI